MPRIFCKSLGVLVTLACIGGSSASAAPIKATVLQVDRAHHLVRVVTPSHTVRAFRFGGRLGHKVTSGERVSVRPAGRRSARIRPLGRAHAVRFYAKVLTRAAPGVTVRLGDGSRFRLRSSVGGAHRRRKARSAARGNRVVPISGLKPGQSVLVTITLKNATDGAVTVELAGPDQGDGASVVSEGDNGAAVNDNGGRGFTAQGTVTAVSVAGGTLTLRAPQGELHFVAESSVLDGTSVDDTVKVSYSKRPDGTLVADDVTDTSPSGVSPGGGADAAAADAGSDSSTAPTTSPGGGVPVTPSGGGGGTPPKPPQGGTPSPPPVKVPIRPRKPSSSIIPRYLTPVA